MKEYKRDVKGRFVKGTEQPNGFGKGKQKEPWNKGKKTGIVPKTAFGGLMASYKQGKGNENTNYIHGRRCNGAKYPYSPEFMIMRKLIIDRDKICMMCGNSAKTIHHIDLNKDNNDKSNLILLCTSCHSSCHGKYIEKEFIKIFGGMIEND